MSYDRDYQRSKAYAWEDGIVHNHDASFVKFSDAQKMVDWIWSDQGLRYPPRIAELPPQRTRAIADASRIQIRIPPKGIQTSILLHELAHSMCPSHGHGPRWVGMFMLLLEKYYRIDLLKMMYFANKAGVQFDLAGPELLGAKNAK